ncbi:MAG: hypothetical protein LBR54_00210 [Oscillospiraceae bacterium]|jgi:hypothetical protein|nr:hypothetical protein [Oscillospiraceae bacterium]
MNREYGITFLNYHSFLTFGAILSKRDVPFPQQIFITETVPYSNTEYDFSMILGEKIYKPITIKYTFTLVRRVIELEIFDSRVTQFEEWLTSPAGKSRLDDDRIRLHHFMAKCTKISHEISPYTAIIDTEFTADPIRIFNYGGEKCTQ